MDTRATALKILKIFNEARARSVARTYGAKVTRNDRSGVSNPNDSTKKSVGLLPGHGRDRVNPRKPMR